MKRIRIRNATFWEINQEILSCSTFLLTILLVFLIGIRFRHCMAKKLVQLYTASCQMKFDKTFGTYNILLSESKASSFLN